MHLASALRTSSTAPCDQLAMGANFTPACSSNMFSTSFLTAFCTAGAAWTVAAVGCVLLEGSLSGIYTTRSAQWQRGKKKGQCMGRVLSHSDDGSGTLFAQWPSCTMAASAGLVQGKRLMSRVWFPPSALGSLLISEGRFRTRGSGTRRHLMLPRNSSCVRPASSSGATHADVWEQQSDGAAGAPCVVGRHLEGGSRRGETARELRISTCSHDRR